MVLLLMVLRLLADKDHAAPGIDKTPELLEIIVLPGGLVFGVLELGVSCHWKTLAMNPFAADFCLVGAFFYS